MDTASDRDRPISWARKFFKDHPRWEHRSTGDTSGIYNPNLRGKDTLRPKVFCIQCLQAEVGDIMARELGQVADGLLEVARTAEQVETEIWARPVVSRQTKGRVILRPAGSTLLNHLKTCPNQSEEIRKEAAKQAKKSPSDSSNQPGPRSPMRSRSRQPAAHVVGVSRTSASIPRLSHMPRVQVPPASGNIISLNSPPGSPIPRSISLLSQADDVISSVSSWSSSDIAPSDSISAVNSRPSSRNQQMLPSTGTTWSGDQYRFEELIARLTASAGLPLSWVDNIEFDTLVREFIPGIKSISRKSLSRRILPTVIKQVRSTVSTALLNEEVTLQGDGWTGLNHTHLVSFMASTAKAKIYTVAVFDTSKDRKTAEEFLKLIEKAYNKVKDEWKAVPIGFVSDASGESRKGRCMLAAKHPELVVMDCYAHQINLIVGDYFSKSNAADLHFTDQATDLITWLRSKTLILSHLAKAVIRAVLTRWTAHYLAFVRLIELREKLLELVYRDAAQPDEKKRIMKTGNAQAQKKAVEMISLIKNEAFWEALSSIVTHLEPLAIAANVIQAAHCRLDQVLLTFGYLFYFYSTMRVNDTRGRDAIISSIEARWKKCDQEVFIAAVILNPIYRNQAFSSIPAFNNAGIQDLMVRLWNRIFPDERIILDEFSNHLDDYLYGQGTFVNLQNRIDLELGNAMSNHRSPDPAQIFKGFTYPGMPGTQFIRLALRILGISANSASCERLFSVFGNTLTKLRNRLGVQTLTDLTELKMHIRDEHQRKAESKRLKRRFAVRGQKTRDEIQNTLQQSPHVLSNVDALNSNDTDQSEPRTTSFRSMMERNIAAVTDDEDDVASTGSGSVPLLSGTVHTLQSQGGIPIQKLFNFSNQRWINLHLNRTKANLTEELALYELLEAENDGDSNGLIDLDETNEDLLSI